VGENGAGKSTAMKILFGQLLPDSGQILLNGTARQWRSPADAIGAGFGMVHQHFMLAGNHTAVENVVLATKSFALAPLHRRRVRARLEQLLRDFHMEVELDRPVEELPVGMQQRIEILKLLYCDSEILILDEPTAVLAPSEIAALFQTLKQMAAQGKTILIVTHKLKEVMSLANRVTVFRAGRVVAEREVSATSVREIASLMIGRELASFEETGTRSSASGEQVVLELRGVRPRREDSRLKTVSFRLRAGEVLGVAGVEGNGQTELIRLLRDPRHELGAGELFFFGKQAGRWSGGEVRAQPVGIFPEDRLAEGVLLDSTLEENFLLGKTRKREFRSGGLLRWGAIRASTAAALREFDVRPADPSAIIRGLSGGNQQKLVVARELGDHPHFLLAAQPTRGVDVGAIEFIHSQILERRNSGAGVLLISSELDEVLKLSDRLLVLYRGEVVGSFTRADFDEQGIGLLMAGGHL
jgi:simple sugar transport system ATP-binding protein